MNLSALNPGQRLAYRWLVRPFLSAEERSYFEGIPGVTGQMYRAERRALHDAIVRRAPEFAFEIGTFNGGGSTFFSAKALARLGRGQLVTLEIDPVLQAKAVELYATRLPALRPRVEFLLGSSPELFRPYLEKVGSAEFVFLDGAENAEQTLAQFRFFEPWFHPGSVLALHDWETEKMRLVKERLAATPQWQCLVALRDPVSVGFMIFQRT